MGGANDNSSGGGDFAFIWDEKNGLQNLNELLMPPRADWKLTVAHGINNSMQIVGQGLYQGVMHGFLLTRVGTAVTESLALLLLE